MQFCRVNCFLPGVVVVASCPEKEKREKKCNLNIHIPSSQIPAKLSPGNYTFLSYFQWMQQQPDPQNIKYKGKESQNGLGQRGSQRSSTGQQISLLRAPSNKIPSTCLAFPSSFFCNFSTTSFPLSLFLRIYLSLLFVACVFQIELPRL